jgi:hypothetical protein
MQYIGDVNALPSPGRPSADTKSRTQRTRGFLVLFFEEGKGLLFEKRRADSSFGANTPIGLRRSRMVEWKFFGAR